MGSRSSRCSRRCDDRSGAAFSNSGASNQLAVFAMRGQCLRGLCEI